MPDNTDLLLIAIILLLVSLLMLLARQLLRSQHGSQLAKTTQPAPVLPEPASHMPASAGQLLTPREREVALLAARGFTNRQIGAETGLSVNTISNYLKRVYAKLGISSRTELAWRLQYLDIGTDDAPDVAG